MKKIIIPAIFIALVAAISVIFPKPAKYERSKGSIFIAQADGQVDFYYKGKYTANIDGRIGKQSLSLYSNKAAVLISEKTDRDLGYSLYLFEKKPLFIDDGVYLCWISASGNVIAYVKEFDYSKETAQLWLYSGGKITLITSEFLVDSGCFVSPNGSAICYTTLSGEDNIGFVWDGSEHELGKNRMPFAVADGAKYIYYGNENEVIYVQKGKNNENREQLGDADIASVAANRDLSQIVFRTDAKSYISRNGKTKEPLSGLMYFLIMPSGTAMQKTEDNIPVYSVSNFADTFYISGEGGVMHINSKYETSSVVKEVSSAFLADNGKTLTYTQNGKIYKLNGAKKNAEPVEIVADDIVRFAVVSDGSAVFFSNEDNELYYQKGKNKPVLVSSNVSISPPYYFPSYYFPYLNAQGALFNGDTIYYASENKLYYSNGGAGKLVSGIDDDVDYVMADENGIFVYAGNDSVSFSYYSRDGKNFILLN
ncbi:MAG: hypothetical protein LBS21_04610 [Clostridiales bacterium]|jgi:hypothetical protein|nr:hypothetical protein [Clostridiales bacterium]